MIVAFAAGVGGAISLGLTHVVAPELSMVELSDATKRRKRPVVAVPPIISGSAVKGPVAKIMQELGHQPSSLSVAEFYRGLVHFMMIDRRDSVHAPAIRRVGIRPVLSDIMMRDLDDRRRLARECCDVLSGHRT